jgi:tripartite-type tricarboxylate transporter receptor subunit TctC
MNRRHTARLVSAIVATAALQAPIGAYAQDGKDAAAGYPSRPVRFITPAAPGGTTDILARLFSQRLTEQLKQQFIVDNRASASGVIGAEITKNSPPDGYTLFLGYHQHTVNAALNSKLPYHAVNDFTPITQLTRAGLMLVVNPSHPAKTVKEFVDWTKSYQGPINFGSAGNGSGGHLAGELYKLVTGIKAQHIPYKGSGPSLTALAGGEYHFNFVGMQAAQGLVKGGKLRALAVTTPKRIGALPDLPAMAEVLPGFEVVGWYGVMAPPKMAKPLVNKLHSELITALNRADTKDRIIADGSEPVGSTPEDFRRFLLADLDKWAKVVKASGAKLD